MPEILKKNIVFPFQAHYSVSHQPTFQEEEVWVLFHGYGQLAEFFIRKFQNFDSPNRLFVAPEGTNYAYLNGFEGRVGANWMTSHDREISIENNHRFLDLLLESLLSGYQKNPRINILGFSQGAATATRWTSRWSGSVDRLFLCSGGFAHDLVLEESRTQFAQTEITLIFGEKDRMITSESIEKQKDLTSKLKKKPEIWTFEGGHELDEGMLQRIFDSNK
jgi:predicted esterase